MKTYITTAAGDEFTVVSMAGEVMGTFEKLSAALEAVWKLAEGETDGVY